MNCRLTQEERGRWCEVKSCQSLASCQLPIFTRDFVVNPEKIANSKCQLYINFMIYYVVDTDTFLSQCRVDWRRILDFRFHPRFRWQRNWAHNSSRRRWQLGETFFPSSIRFFFHHSDLGRLNSAEKTCQFMTLKISKSVLCHVYYPRSFFIVKKVKLREEIDERWWWWWWHECIVYRIDWISIERVETFNKPAIWCQLQQCTYRLGNEHFE